ncbi:MAG: type II CRISPR RNA-guided endonuclease Cas9 [Paludibacteraceae bacterium]|nr:type II CRISPR RNA-guided endonuclease Cas9 [Paludibacteraceae bacterium]
MKKILGLDLGTNSIGWAVVNADENGNPIGIDGMGSRIIPMDAATLGDFDRGISISQTAERTRLRGVRHLLERCLLRRERLHRVLDILGFLPSHYLQALNRYGQIKEGEEPKLAWCKNCIGKYEFLFVDSFNEMLEDFKMVHPELAGKKIPYDWTIYYLRKKALTQKISKEELAWVLLNFNQKRGYYQLRGEEEETVSNKKVEYVALKVVSVEDTGEKRGKDVWYNVHLENGWIYRRTSDVPLDWVGKIKEFIVTTDINEDGTPKKDKDGNVKRSFRSPKEDDWTLIKERTQSEITDSGKTVGAYIYDSILQNPSQKVRGKLVRTIERKFYKEELKRIVDKQTEYHPELQNDELYKACIEELYPSNEAYRLNIANRNFTYLFVDDILFYQRPLKTKKSLIANCPYEEHIGIDKATGEEKKYGVKCIAKSHPLYQEFRLWQFLSNLRIYKKGLADDVDVTQDFLKTEEDYVALFDWLNEKKTITQKSFLKYPAFGLKKDADNYRWNYVEDKEYPCNETRAQLLSYLSKAGISSDFLTAELEERLWHLLYSIDDKQELGKALHKYAETYSLDDSFVETFQKFPPFKKEYGAYSAKAIKKLLALMRMGKYWAETTIDDETRIRIEKIVTGEYDEKIKNRVREKAIHFTDVSQFKGLPLWLACYVVYGRHSETKDIAKWESPDDLQKYLDSFKQHSLRNPIVEQVITETMRTVHDIWAQYGIIDEIHVELGREMKNPADKRKKMTQQIADNENTNLRIKALLMEFANPEFEIENVRPYSPSQQDILRIYEEGVLDSVDNIPEEIDNVLKKFKESDVKKRPTRSEVLRYKLWLEQKYRSPYTGQPIPLAKLFTSAYEIEHVIPQSRYFDDSFSNKVICESEVNKLKDNQLGFEFIKKHHGEKIELSFGKVVKIFTEEEYEQFVKDHYGRNRAKMRKLLMDSIPEEFIARQLNDSRYISKVVKGLLSNIVREEGEEESISKNVIVCTGGVTDRLKKDWGLNDKWNELILPRFQRLNEITGTNSFTAINSEGHLIPSMPLELQKGFNKKRIDHRHHAMDAIVIACANRNIVNYLNNESASSKAQTSRYDLQKVLCEKVKTDSNGNYKWTIKKPWTNFAENVYSTLNNTIVSFKQNLRVINKATNMYVRFEDDKKNLVKQEGTNWAIRKPMHKDTVFGEVNLRKIKVVSLNEAIKNPSRIVEKEFKAKLSSLLMQGYDAKKVKKYFETNKDIWQDINLSKIAVYYFTKETKDRYFATRKSLDTSFNKKKIEESVTDTGIQKILLRHLELKENNPELAFSADGIDEMNRNIIGLNGGKFHQPILKVRYYEEANKFAIGEKGNKFSKFVEADDGTNLYFAIYEEKEMDSISKKLTPKRAFATIPLKAVIERRIQGLSPVPVDYDGKELKFFLSPNDLVYVPTIEEINSSKINLPLDCNRLYKMVSANKKQCFFIKGNVASSIINKYEYSSSNKMERAITGEMIKEVCIPVKVDRLGRIIKLGY